MSGVDPLQLAAGYYAGERWDQSHWRRFGRETGTTDILNSHPRLYRSLDFGDEDYPDAAFQVIGRVLREGPEAATGEAGRMELIADSMPDLPEWTATHAPPRTRRLFNSYLSARSMQEIPSAWRSTSQDEQSPENAKADIPPEWQLEDVVRESVAKVKIPHAGADAEDSRDAEEDTLAAEAERTIFIVHGHDEAARDSIMLFTNSIVGSVPIVLANEPALGRTIIEKFEEVGGRASRVIVLLTPDDKGASYEDAESGNLSARARQNVIFELGYFVGKLGRSGVIIINGGVEIPSDISGYNYISYPGDNWKYQLQTELLSSE
ncbi:TIR domain-containing protein [Micrococcus endophyticus]|uniref:TIR domain-containing protein n=1 Tax=Micrococcus endophyticus TaxID=455343 RepID=UPI0034CE1E4E